MFIENDALQSRVLNAYGTGHVLAQIRNRNYTRLCHVLSLSAHAYDFIQTSRGNQPQMASCVALAAS
jgi:hypothetical protein